MTRNLSCRNLSCRSLLTACLLSLVQNAHTDAMQDLLAILEPVQGFSAHFTQDTFNAQHVIQQHNEGELIAETPNAFYWKTYDPYPQEIVTDGKTLWVYDPDLQQVTIKPFDDSYTRTPAMLFAGNSQRIAEQFTVETVSDKPSTFRLLPKSDKKDLFESLEMTFDNGAPVSMTIRDAMQQESLLHFTDVKMNPSTPANKFIFVVPAGVDVLKAK